MHRTGVFWTGDGCTYSLIVDAQNWCTLDRWWLYIYIQSDRWCTEQLYFGHAVAVHTVWLLMHRTAVLWTGMYFGRAMAVHVLWTGDGCTCTLVRWWLYMYFGQAMAGAEGGWEAACSFCLLLFVFHYSVMNASWSEASWCIMIIIAWKSLYMPVGLHAASSSCDGFWQSLCIPMNQVISQ